MSRIHHIATITGYCAVLLGCLGTMGFVGYRTYRRVTNELAVQAARTRIPAYGEVPIVYFFQPG